MTSHSPGWYGDPLGRHEYRYWDGTAWSELAADGGITVQDPLTLTPPAPAPSGAVPMPSPISGRRPVQPSSYKPPAGSRLSPEAVRKPKWRRKRDAQFAESAIPSLEPGEEVREIFMGSGWPMNLYPIWLSVAKRLIVVTDRNVYEFSKSRGTFRVNAVLYKARLGDVTAECGFAGLLQVGEAPRVFSTLDSGWGVRKRVAAMINEASMARPAAS